MLCQAVVVVTILLTSHIHNLSHGGTVVIGGRHRGSVAGDLSSDGVTVLVGGHQSDPRSRLAGRRH